MEKFALIVAGGSGTRMNSEIPKQFLELAGKPLLMRTMERFVEFDREMGLVLVLPEAYMRYWKGLCKQHRFDISHQLVAGGKSRFQSVKSGLALLPNEGLVFIHDGVRPFVSLQTIRNCEETATEYGNAVPVMPLTESLRFLSGQISRHVERAQYVLVQTPQTFQLSTIQRAYQIPEANKFTDDASVCEAMGEQIRLVEGNAENIKITRPLDFQIAKFLFREGDSLVPR